ncbi:MAG: PhoPQ-activated pathogenicity protein [Phycisphaera sp.]|nr:PhoPQ-activated pathogenicity protein [Phycisphaera sp.]
MRCAMSERSARRAWGTRTAWMMAACACLGAAASLHAADIRPAVADTVLGKYVAAPDDSFGWTRRREGKLGISTYTELILTSQTWRDLPWKHQLFIIKPSVMRAGDQQAMLFITGGSWRDELEQPPAADARLPREAAVFASIAEQLQSPVAVLLQVPRQPLFGNLHEDQIIALTFEKYLDTGDETWPLLLPMTKAAVRAMDAVQQFAAKTWDGAKITGFTVTGASKRGWTTWLTGAVDQRANAIAPMVIDTLNMGPQMKHSIDAWGRPSDQIRDYTERHLHERLAEPAGQKLREIVDPYTYRAALTQPKLLLIGTNDDYWPLDAANLYWGDLTGNKHLVYVPNNRHDLRDLGRVVGSIVALHRHVTGQQPLPNLVWKFTPNGQSIDLRVGSDVKPASVTAWVATSTTRDFRQSQWTAQPTQTNDAGDAWTFDMPYPQTGYTAFFAEATYGGAGLPYYLSTNVRIVGPDGEVTVTRAAE